MPESDGFAAVLLQLSGTARQLADLEHQQAATTAAIRGRLDALTSVVQQLKADVAGHDETLAGLVHAGEASGTSEQDRSADAGLDAVSGYEPTAAPNWWKLSDADRDTAIAKLRAWVVQIYRPGYGHLARGLCDCWDQHPLCLYVLDWLSELWSVLYLQPARTAATLAAQAEWHTRLLPAAAAQLAQETRGCHHPRGDATASNSSWQVGP